VTGCHKFENYVRNRWFTRTCGAAQAMTCSSKWTPVTRLRIMFRLDGVPGHGELPSRLQRSWCMTCSGSGQVSLCQSVDTPRSPADQWEKLGLSDRQASVCRGLLSQLTAGTFDRRPLFFTFFFFFSFLDPLLVVSLVTLSRLSGVRTIQDDRLRTQVWSLVCLFWQVLVSSP
jgi:hypothetical protein